mmetsp:Transcript_10214/g.23079  ORF Transcript_10214/g.23079 Transcript_10214/m.23079 type:complete len:254 (+) Transcript_10214:126-887(+)
MSNLSRVAAKRKHASLHAHSLELRRVEVVRRTCKLLKVHISTHIHLARVDLHDFRARILGRMRELNLTVNAATSQKRRIENVCAVRCRDDLNVVVAPKSVKLVQQLEHRSLYLSVAAQLAVKALCSDGVNLVDENDRGTLLLSECEGVTHELRAISDEHLNELRSRELEEARVRLRGASARDERLSRSRWAVQQHALRRLDSNLFEALLVCHGKHDRLDKFLNLLVKPANVAVVLGGFFVHLHGFHTRVVLRG